MSSFTGYVPFHIRFEQGAVAEGGSVGEERHGLRWTKEYGRLMRGAVIC